MPDASSESSNVVGISSAPQMSLRGICKSFGDQPVLDRLDLDLYAGEYVVLLGPSGCGKSTLLHMIAGLITPDAGDIVSTDSALRHPVLSQRDVSILFQDDRLYPHWNLKRNLSVATLRSRSRQRSEIAITEIAKRLGIDGLLHRRPDQISGGQLRRAALAKAILRQPAICLLDEPLTAIDSMLREDVLSMLEGFSRQRDGGLPPTTIVHVTHDGEEAMRVADRVVVLGNGRVLQSATPEEIYRRPNRVEVARAIGSPPANLVPMALIRAMSPACDHGLLRQFSDCSDRCMLVVRPEDIRLQEGRNELAASEEPGQQLLKLPVRMESSRLVAGRYYHRLRVEGAEPSLLWSVGPSAANQDISTAIISLRNAFVIT